MQCGPSASWPVVFVPIGGPRNTAPVSITTLPPVTATPKRSMPRGAGPPFFSPTRLYCEPWHGHSNHCDDGQLGTRQPRCGHFWYSATMPLFIALSTDGDEAYALAAFGSASLGYSVIHVRA